MKWKVDEDYDDDQMTRITRMPRMQRIARKKMIAATMRLSSQILPRRRSPRENEKPSRRTKRDEPGEDEGEGGGDDRDERKRKRKPTTCLPTANHRSNES